MPSGPSSEQPAGYPGPHKVMVVEDDTLIRMLSSDLLEEFGFTVQQAADGVEAIQLLTYGAEAYTAVLTDIVMPGGVDGIGLARTIVDKWPWISVLIVSGHPDLCELGVPSGIRYILKPWRPEQLVEFLKGAGSAGRA